MTERPRMRARRLSLRTKLLAFNVGMVVVTLAVLLGLDLAFERVRINGPLYKAIDGGQAVVADILNSCAVEGLLDQRLGNKAVFDQKSRVAAKPWQCRKQVVGDGWHRSRLQFVRQEYPRRP